MSDVELQQRRDALLWRRKFEDKQSVSRKVSRVIKNQFLFTIRGGSQGRTLAKLQ
jgi:hypothetical protein